MANGYKRISLLLREEQYDHLSQSELNLSGLIRDLLDDYLSEYKITIGVGKDTRNLYDQIVSNTGSSDEDLEAYLKSALKEMLRDKIKQMQSLEKKIR